MLVSAPASSANLGAGFDSLALAVDIGFWLGSSPFDTARGSAVRAVESHPASVAHRDAGGQGELWWSSAIPPGRGLGFSGASRVAGSYLALRQSGRGDDEARHMAYRAAAALEGHPENAAASAYGGLVVSCGSDAVTIGFPSRLLLALWWPQESTSTDASRIHLPAEVPLSDAVFNLSRSALFVAAIAAGRFELLATATEDRLHQADRLRSSPESAEVLDRFRSGGSLASWLSGSGPTVAALVDRERNGVLASSADALAAEVSASLGGRPVTIAAIEPSGVVEVAPHGSR